MKRYFILLFIVIGGCTENDVKETNIVTISDPKVEDPQNYSDLFSSDVKYIFLKSDIQLSKVNKVIVHRGYIYIQNEINFSSQELLKIDMNGKLIERYGRNGKGPSEYVFMQGFSIDKSNDNVCVYDRGGKKVITYSNDGKFITEFKVGPSYFSDFIIKNSNYYLFTDYKDFDNEHYLHIYDKKGKIITRKFEIPYDFTNNLPYAMKSYFFESETDNFLFKTINSREIYSITSDTILNSKLVLDFQKFNRINHILTAKDVDNSLKEGLVALTYNFINTDEFLLFNYLFEDRKLKRILYFKNKKTYLKLGRLINDIDGFLFEAIGGFENNVIIHVRSEYINRYINSNLSKNKIDDRILDSIRNEDRSILAIYQILKK